MGFDQKPGMDRDSGAPRRNSPRPCISNKYARSITARVEGAYHHDSNSGHPSRFGWLARHHGVDMERLHLFEHERDRVSRIAARILGSESDADDVLQEALPRLSRSED
jgi:Sigma-70 region 2